MAPIPSAAAGRRTLRFPVPLSFQLRSPTRTTVFAALTALCLVAAGGAWDFASAANDELAGRNVSDDQLTAIVSAAHSCPVLTPARLAGQLMAESGMDADATRTASGGQGIAGLRDDDWQRWAPWPRASRRDDAASILALAHEMCDLSGQLRQAGVPGEPWRLALAAFRSGLPAVQAAGRVPTAATGYVDAAGGYATWYDRLPQFGNLTMRMPVAGSTTGASAGAKPLPDEYRQPVLAAGSVCQQVSPSAVAAQLMAASAFNPNLQGSGATMGIAQFRPEVWATYAPAGASVWEPAAAIPVLGTAMCGMLTELSGLRGDPYLLALAAFRIGPTTVRSSGGTVDVITKNYLVRVASYTTYYGRDVRLGGGPTGSASPSAAGSRSPSRQTSSAPRKSTRPSPSRQSPNALVSKLSGKCISAGAGGFRTRLTIRPCDGSAAQHWDVRNDGTIRALSGCMDVANASSTSGTAVQLFECNGTPAQQWSFSGSGPIRNTQSKKCLDIDGSGAEETVDGAMLNIWDCVDYANQFWTFVR